MRHWIRIAASAGLLSAGLLLAAGLRSFLRSPEFTQCVFGLPYLVVHVAVVWALITVVSFRPLAYRRTVTIVGLATLLQGLNAAFLALLPTLLGWMGAPALTFSPWSIIRICAEFVLILFCLCVLASREARNLFAEIKESQNQKVEHISNSADAV